MLEYGDELIIRVSTDWLQQYWCRSNCFNCFACHNYTMLMYALVRDAYLRFIPVLIASIMQNNDFTILHDAAATGSKWLKLRVISCTHLPDDIGNVGHQMVQLHLCSCNNLKSLPDSFGQLKALQQLTLLDCSSLQMLPDAFGRLAALQKLTVSNCSSLRQLPKTFGRLAALQKLYLNSCDSLHKLPDTIGQLAGLQSLYLISCSSLQRLPDTFGQLATLQELFISNCNCLESLPETFGQLAALQEMTLSKCNSLQMLPGAFGQLTTLQRLTLSSCSSLEDLPESFGQLAKLQELKLSQCSSLQSLPDTFGRLAGLQKLELSHCSSLQSLPHTFGRLVALQELELSHCSSLQSLPDTFGCLVALQKLKLCHCSNLQSLPDTFGQLVALQMLELSHCSSLQSLPDTFGQLAKLQELKLSHCSSLSSLPESSGQLVAVQEINLLDCSSLVTLPISFAHVITLKRLSLSGCSNLEELYLINCMHLSALQLDRCSSLWSLTLEGCHGLQSPGTWAGRPLVAQDVKSLREVRLVNCRGLQEAPEFVRKAPQLQLFEAINCANLTDVDVCRHRHISSISFSGCLGLTSLKLAGCTSLGTLPELDSNSRLTLLDLSGCSSLTRLPATLGELGQLQRLELSGCYSLKALPLFMDKLTSLTELNLQSCYSLTVLPQSVHTKLQKLNLSYCPEMDSLAQSLVNLEPYLVPAGTQVALRGWGELLDNFRDIEQDGTITMTAAVAQRLRRATIIQRLLNDQSTILELLSRLSWLGVLLAAATFTGAIAPPGGYDQGLLFLDYSRNDCRGYNETAAYSSVINCNTTTVKQNCTISSANPGGCVHRPSDCTSIGGISCKVMPNVTLLHIFFVLDLLSFGLSMTLVLLVVACSIPRTGWVDPAAAAGLIWMSLFHASTLLFVAVESGMMALLAGVLAVYPSAQSLNVVGPVLVSAILSSVVFSHLQRRLFAIYPGNRAIIEAVKSMWFDALSRNPLIRKCFSCLAR
jgi:Leucine-rich repeat (LRR) protein